MGLDTFQVSGRKYHRIKKSVCQMLRLLSLHNVCITVTSHISYIVFVALCPRMKMADALGLWGDP